MKAGPLMVDIAGIELQADERERLLHPSVSGVVLFTRNFESLEQLTALVHELKNVKSPKLLIAVDQEGGRVQRFHSDFSKLPALQAIGEMYLHSAEQGLKCARDHAYLMASEILATGIDISFAPVLDIDFGLNQVIGERAFSNDVEIICKLATEYIAGMHEAGMKTTGKHFPGHGSVTADSHVALPIDERSREQIFNLDLVPFRQLSSQLDAIMISHVIYSAVDSWPAGFSQVWVKQVLEDELNFKGMIFSDDITMQAAASIGSHTERANRALAAGCHCVMSCNDSAGRDEIIDNLKVTPSEQLYTHINAMYGIKPFDFSARKQSSRWQAAHATIEHLLSN